MGACVSNPSGSKPARQLTAGLKGCQPLEPLPPPVSKFKELELYLLGLMYDDLAKRDEGSIVSRDTFQVFFNNCGLMAELMFSKFDEQKTGSILKEQFLKAFEINVKGTEEERADALFQFYSMEKAGGIQYGELLRILLSYPLQDLNTMIFEEKFLKELGDHMISYYFGPENKIRDKTIIEEQSEVSTTEIQFQPTSLYCPTSLDLIHLQGKIQKMIEEENSQKERGQVLPPLFKKEHLGHTDAAKKNENVLEGDFPMKKTESMSLLDVKKIKKSCKLKSNITSVAKRYANFLFTSANLDKEKDVFSKRQFYALLKRHPSILDVYLAGFHTHVWEVDDSGRPKYTYTPAQIQSNCKLLVHNLSTEVYLKLVKNTILVFDDEASRRPKNIINLEGLIVEAASENGQSYVKLRHRDKLYAEKTITFLEKEQDWLKQLQYFKEICILTDYVRLERIGKGNFSTVYKCRSKTHENELAALKVINPAKLNPNEREVLKREIGILKQCHHPNIVKFYQEYKTESKIYIVTELCSEGDLFDYTRKKGFLEEYEAALILRQLTEAIIYLNKEMGIIHRDLKPENIMVITTSDKKIIKRVKIIDFGFGVYKDQLKDLTPDEKFAGTPGFMAPEVLEMKEFDEKIDTFSLGIILYFMLSGYLPFQSNYFEEIRELTLNCNITLQNDHWGNVSAEAKELIRRILTFTDKRISTKKVLEHPWLGSIDSLKRYEGTNKKRIKILD